MKAIKILKDELISQIAAGEVIERPASVIKELVENSLDAGATRVSIEVEEGGMKKLRVQDNGSGIPSDQVKLAFERHATSKLLTIDDLFSISSLGFRGEALASIASVSRVIMLTSSGDVGVELEMNGGKEVRFEEKNCPTGTDITVLGLFHHTPARKKYMKTERTEYGRIFDMITQIALAHPEVGFRVKRDGKEVLELPEKQDFKDRIRVLYGNSTANALIPVTFHQSNLVINGFVGKPELSRSSKKYQFLFVNGRSIESRMIGHAVKEGFHSLLMHEKHPWYLLDIQMDPQFLDVNVHPRKLEVKFVNQQEVYKAVRGAVYHALETAALSPIVDREEKAPASFSFPSRSIPAGRSFAPIMKLEERAVEPENREIFEVAGTFLRPVAQIANSYIIAESEEGLVLIDQHAAHERVRYMRLMMALENSKPESQPLLTPLEMDLGADSARLVEEYMEDFKAMGFDLEPFGDHTFLLRAVPSGIENRDPEQVVMDVIADVTKEWKQNHVKNLKEFLLTYTACRGAIKFGDPLTMSEMQGLVRDMESTKHSTHCPHGRPAIVTLTFDKLETLFKRKNF